METIVSEVINKEGSLYRQMIAKASSVGMDYFGGVEIGNTLARGVNMEMKQKVVEQIEKKYDLMIAEDNLEENVLKKTGERIDRAIREMGKDTTNRSLMKVVNTLRQYAKNRLLFIPDAPYQEQALREKYEQARKITMVEYIMQNNEKDVIAFLCALIARTEWECRRQIEIQTTKVLENIAEGLERLV